MKTFEEFFKDPSTPEEKADAIIKYLRSFGLTNDQILKIIQTTREKLEVRTLPKG